jgi:hypothetical protein
MKRLILCVVLAAACAGAFAQTATQRTAAANALLQQAVTARSLSTLKDALAKGADPRPL